MDPYPKEMPSLLPGLLSRQLSAKRNAAIKILNSMKTARYIGLPKVESNRAASPLAPPCPRAETPKSCDNPIKAENTDTPSDVSHNLRHNFRVERIELATTK